MYIDYNYYSANGGDASVTSAIFSRLARRVQADIDRITQHRIDATATIDDNIKYLMVDAINLYKKADDGAVSSFNNDGYQVTFAESLTDENLFKKFNNLAMTYLSGLVDANGTPLLYLGVD